MLLEVLAFCLAVIYLLLTHLSQRVNSVKCPELSLCLLSLQHFTLQPLMWTPKCPVEFKMIWLFYIDLIKRWRKCVGVIGVEADTLEAVGGLLNSCHEMFCALGSGSRFSVIPQALHCLLKRSLSVFRRSHDELWQTSGSHLKSGSGCAEDTERTHCIFGCRWHEYLLRVISFLPSSLCVCLFTARRRG